MRNLHLGLTPWNFTDLCARSLCDQAQFAEACGYESIWLPESHFGDNALPDPLTLLASIAGATDKIRLGTTSYLLTLRNPLQAAEQVAVLDQLSGGRLILGVGRGYAPDMLKAFQVPAKEKRRIFAWTLGLMRDAWAGKAISLDDDEANAVEVYPRPVQLPEPPIWVAAFGPKALAQAGRLGLPYLCSPMESLATLQQNYAQHRQAVIDAGAEIPTVVPLMRTVFVSEDVNMLKTIRQQLAMRVENSRLQAGETVNDWTIVGEPIQVADTIADYQERVGMTHLIATRLRIGGLEEGVLRGSVQLLAELVGAR
ncbi:MAG: LLM class flavin-dependent oxidoreductase [Gammaproteobacteria bacterium]|nr:LLM class flavin-dependent oxidoreductase [Gammaproteobacteria bacterium]